MAYSGNKDVTLAHLSLGKASCMATSKAIGRDVASSLDEVMKR